MIRLHVRVLLISIQYRQISKISIRQLLRLSLLCLFFFSTMEIGYAASFELTLSGDVQKRYTDNVSYSVDNSEEEYITVVTPRLKIDSITDLTDIGISAYLKNFTHKEKTERDNTDQSFEAFWKQSWTPLLKTKFAAGHTKDQRRDRVLEETGLLTLESERHCNDYRFESHFSVSELFSIFISYNLQSEEYDIKTAYDTIQHTAQVAISRQLDDFLAATIGGIRFFWGNYAYTNDRIYNTSSVDEMRRIGTYGLVLSMDHSFSETIQVNIALGMRNSEFNNETTIVHRYPQWFNVANDNTEIVIENEDDSQMFTMTLSIAYNRWQSNYSISFSHDLEPASGRSGLTERNHIAARLLWNISQDFHMSNALTCFSNKSDQTETVYKIEELTYTFKTAIAYKIGGHWTLHSWFAHSESDDRENDIRRQYNLIAIMLGWRLPILG